MLYVRYASYNYVNSGLKQGDSIYMYKVVVSVYLCFCLPDFSKTCGMVSMKPFMVHKGHR